MIKILIAEDNLELNQLISKTLINKGYLVKSCFDGQEALCEFENDKYHLVLTDIMMPNLDGFELAKSIRDFDKTTPIVFMTAKDDKPSKMFGFNIGIDDYIVKPFDVDILLMKISAILRRSKIANEGEITIGNFYINKEERIATVNGEEISLSVREFDILFKFLSYPKKTFTRSSLMDEFWGYDCSATSRTVDVYMVKLRDKTALCDGFEIVTVHGLGYKAVLKWKEIKNKSVGRFYPLL